MHDAWCDAWLPVRFFHEKKNWLGHDLQNIYNITLYHFASPLEKDVRRTKKTSRSRLTACSAMLNKHEKFNFSPASLGIRAPFWKHYIAEAPLFLLFPSSPESPFTPFLFFFSFPTFTFFFYEGASAEERASGALLLSYRKLLGARRPTLAREPEHSSYEIAGRAAVFDP